MEEKLHRKVKTQAVRTLEKALQEQVRPIDCCAELGVVEVLHGAIGVLHSQGVVDEQRVVVLSQVEGTLRPHPVVQSYA